MRYDCTFDEKAAMSLLWAVVVCPRIRRGVLCLRLPMRLVRDNCTSSTGVTPPTHITFKYKYEIKTCIHLIHFLGIILAFFLFSFPAYIYIYVYMTWCLLDLMSVPCALPKECYAALCVVVFSDPLWDSLWMKKPCLNVLACLRRSWCLPVPPYYRFKAWIKKSPWPVYMSWQEMSRWRRLIQNLI